MTTTTNDKFTVQFPASRAEARRLLKRARFVEASVTMSNDTLSLQTTKKEANRAIAWAEDEDFTEGMFYLYTSKQSGLTIFIIGT